MTEKKVRMIAEKKIAQGSFGTVYLGSYMSHKNCAIKKISINTSSDPFKRYYESECKILQSVKQKNIINIYGISKSKNNLYIAMEHCEGRDIGTILEHCNYIEEPLVKKWTKDLIKSLDYLKDLNIIHRDVKPTNILLTNKKLSLAEVKLVDFGFATMIDQSLKYSKVGTPLYMAPEIMEDSGYDYKADIWSLGIVMYEMLYGSHPYTVNNMRELKEAQKRPIVYAKHKNVSEDAIQVMKSMIKYDPRERMDYEDLLRLPFFVNMKKGFSGSDEDKKSEEQEKSGEQDKSFDSYENITDRKSDASSFILIGKGNSGDLAENKELSNRSSNEVLETNVEESKAYEDANSIMRKDSEFKQFLEESDYRIDIKDVYSRFYELKNIAETSCSYINLALNQCKDRLPYMQKCIINFVDYQCFLIEEDLKLLKIYLEDEIFTYQIEEFSLFVRDMVQSYLKIIKEYREEMKNTTKEELENKIKEELISLLKLKETNTELNEIISTCLMVVKFNAPENEEIEKILSSERLKLQNSAI